MTRILLIMFLTWLVPTTVLAEDVDVAIVFAIDTSGSIKANQLVNIREGHTEAVTDPEILEIIKQGRYGKIAVTYMEWAEYSYVLVPWMIIDDEDSAQSFADQIKSRGKVRLTGGETAVGVGLQSGGDLFRTLSHSPTRRVIDIAGNGVNNKGFDPQPVRDALFRSGVVVNGILLPAIETVPPTYGAPFFTDSEVTMKTLVQYYEDHVVSGFHVQINSGSDFVKVLKRKFYMEVAGIQPDK